MSLHILVSGASGVIGQSLLGLIDHEPHFHLAAQATRDVFFESDAEGDVIIDFSHPALLDQTLAFAVRRGLPLVIGTTGIDADLSDRIEQAASRIAICRAANFSLGVNLLERLVADAAAILGQAFDVEISELHHRRKLDAPSGTALSLGAAVAAARNVDAEISKVTDRSRHRIPRGNDEIGYQAVRGGDVAGEHTVYFLGDGERLELTHRATDRRIFAHGALLAAKRLADRPPGLVGFSELVMQR